MILVVSTDNIIGKRAKKPDDPDSLPWKIISDLSRFKKLTAGCGVIMGRTTWESLPAKFRPLPERENIVLSRNVLDIPGAKVMSSVDDVLEYVKNNQDKTFFIIGGTDVYEQFLNYVSEIHITEVHVHLSAEPGMVQGPLFPRTRSGNIKGFYFAYEERAIPVENEYPNTYKIFREKLKTEDISFLRDRAKKQIIEKRRDTGYIQIESPYEDLVLDVLNNGNIKSDRTGTGTVSLFGKQIRFDLSEEFPLITTKKMAMKPIIYELLWFLQGISNIEYLCKNNVTIWDDWPFEKYQKSSEYAGETLKEFGKKIAEDASFAERWGDLGPVYGVQWRNWKGADGSTHDQIMDVIHQIKNNPDSRRLMVSAWNVAYISKMAIPPCHALFQFYVVDGKLSCQLYQRSADMFLGVPYNIASYALLTMMIAQVCRLELGEFIHTFGDVHIYANHFDQVVEQLSRQPQSDPVMEINKAVTSIDSFSYKDFKLTGYNPHPIIVADVAV